MPWFPDEPAVPEAQRASGESPLRYEDVLQDGRLHVLALPHALGDVIWRKLIANHPVAGAQRSGVIPVLTRFSLEVGEGPISVRAAMNAAGCYQLFHTADAGGAADRIVFNLWLALSAPRGRTHGPPPPGAGEPIPVGRVFAEHVFTRPFAPPGERKVTRLDLPGVPPVPPSRWTWRGPDAVLAPPPDAAPLDERPLPDDAPVRFGLNHTDSNQHVNSLVYPRLFIDAALRRFAARGRSAHVLARSLEIAYRKPCFAGDEARIVLAAYAAPDGLHAIGAFVPERARDAAPYCTLQMRFTD